ncbi:hypothetical protein DB345_17345 [Spartobacteria bacterium LR76]|nr:hypothetical protein DB345_17345 [Spartobacteria bacterium LR76]
MIRREYLREAKARQRAKEKRSGAVVLTVKLSAEQAAVYFAARDRQNGPLSDFAQRCMVRGAMFIASAGNPRGQKLRPVSVPSPAVSVTVDLSMAEVVA